MEYHQALVPLVLLLFALRTLAYGKFKLAWGFRLLWVMFAQMEPTGGMSVAPKLAPADSRGLCEGPDKYREIQLWIVVSKKIALVILYGL